MALNPLALVKEFQISRNRVRFGVMEVDQREAKCAAWRWLCQCASAYARTDEACKRFNGGRLQKSEVNRRYRSWCAPADQTPQATPPLSDETPRPARKKPIVAKVFKHNRSRQGLITLNQACFFVDLLALSVHHQPIGMGVESSKSKGKRLEVSNHRRSAGRLCCRGLHGRICWVYRELLDRFC